MFYGSSKAKIKQIKELRLQSKRSIFYYDLCAGQKADPAPPESPLSRIPVGAGLAPPESILSPFGKIAQEQLTDLQNRYKNVSIDRYVIMPNHIHILMRLDIAGGASPSPTTVSDIVRVFKSLTTRECKKALSIEKLFQRSFYDHIIRDEDDYQAKWQYIDDNPAKWREDSLYVDESTENGPS